MQCLWVLSFNNIFLPLIPVNLVQIQRGRGWCNLHVNKPLSLSPSLFFLNKLDVVATFPVLTLCGGLHHAYVTSDLDPLEMENSKGLLQAAGLKNIEV